MATALSDEFREMALEVVDLFGKDYKLVRRTPSTPDPQHPTKPVFKLEEWVMKAALVALTEEQIKFMPVTREDMQAIVAWNDSLPKKILPGDLIVDGTDEYTIIPPENVYTVNGVIVAAQLFVRR